MPNKPDTLLPAASQVARVVLTSLSYHKRITPDDIRQRGNWLHGAKLLANAMNDQAAAELLQAVDMRLMDIAARPRTDADLRTELGKLMMRIAGNGQDVRP